MPTLRQRGQRQTLTPLTASLLPLSKRQRSERTQWNSNHKHNPTRTNQRHTEQSLKWPLLSNPLGDDLPNVIDRNLKLDLKRLNRTLRKTVRYCMTYLCLKSTVSGVCVCICMWMVHEWVDGLLSAACKNPVWVWRPGMRASIPSCTGLSCGIFVKEGKKSWEANRHREVILVSGCGDWWQGLGLRYVLLLNPRLNWAEIQWIWKGSDGALKPINVLQVDQDSVCPALGGWLSTGHSGKDNLPSHLFTHFAALPHSFLQTVSLCSLHVWWIVFLQLGDTVREGSHESLMCPVHKLLPHHQLWSSLNTFASLALCLCLSNDH